ncbi:hypothetical protein AALB39_27015 [Lachnospiraceae bacterium 54-53]
MACALNRSDRVGTFWNWLKCQSELIGAAEQEGYTKEPERLKREQMNRLLNGDTF